MRDQGENILYLANRAPFPPDKGDRIRTFHHLDRLAQRHNVYCACFCEDDAEARRAERLRRWCRDVIAIPWNRRIAALRAAAAFATGGSLTLAAYRSRAMTRALAGWARQVRFDAVVAFASNMADYALAVPAGRRILDLCDVDSEKWREFAAHKGVVARAVWRREADRLRRFESEALDRFDATILITERERSILDPGGRRENLHVLPNGVELAVPEPPMASGVTPQVGFLGSMDYFPNEDAMTWFCAQVWPRVLKQAPAAQLLIIGRNPTRRVRALAAERNVLVMGEVASAAQHLQALRVFVAPLRIARGLPNKVLEAMAAGRPVVATPQAAGCTAGEPGRHFWVAEEPADFADKVALLCEDNLTCERLGRAGYRLAAGRYGWPGILAEFERIVLGQKESNGPPTGERSAASGDITLCDKCVSGIAGPISGRLNDATATSSAHTID